VRPPLCLLAGLAVLCDEPHGRCAVGVEAVA
jgi:hypothetical protein